MNESFKDLLSALGIDPAYADLGFRAPHHFVVAVRLAELGIRTFPTNTWKEPLFKKFQFLATADIEMLVQWQRGYYGRWNIRESPVTWSVLTGRDSNLFIIDVDGPAGRATLALLEAKYGPLPISWRVSSGRIGGGEHIWLRLPEGVDDPMNQQPLAIDGIKYKGVDIRGWHGYAVLPGSPHVSGNVYGWLPGCSPGDIELAVCPPSWWAVLPKKQFDDDGTPSPKSNSPRAAPQSRVKRNHDPASLLIGDAPGHGGFQDPISKIAIRYFFRMGTDADAEPIIEVLREMIIAAPKGPGRDVSRYLSGPVLPRLVERARTFIIKNRRNPKNVECE